MNVSSEVIWHYTCQECLGWFSIASHSNYKPKKLFCPHCGYKSEHFTYNNNIRGELNDKR